MTSTTLSSRCKALSAAAMDWTLGREWAISVFAVLSAIAILCALMRTRFERAATGSSDSKQAAAFSAFQRSYLVVYVVVMLADWMQGTHMYTLYTEYTNSNSSVSVGTLFLSGFLAAGILGTFTGPLVDKYGRKRACMVYVLLEVTINLLEHINAMHWLMLGRILGGISTSLLFSAFEAWMVTEHRNRGYPEEWLSRTFGLCAVVNGATAILAGILAQVAADNLGDIGPFQVAIGLTMLAGLLIVPWTENHGDSNDKKHDDALIEPAGLVSAWKTVRRERALFAVGAVYALFEGAMYTFVFNWVPTLALAMGGFAQIQPVQGIIFSCLMAAISIGGEVYSFATRFLLPETVGVAVFSLSSLTMAVPVVCELFGCSLPSAFAVQFAAFLGFEMCVGAFQPCMATLRAKYVPDSQQSTVNSLFRFPLNMLVAAGTKLSDYVDLYMVFALCAAAHFIAALTQVDLRWRMSSSAPPPGGGEPPSKAASNVSPKKQRAKSPKRNGTKGKTS
ncbi:hypothetical protein AB1Y20_008047 [Prymnesium parvum]|uniref:Molybdate-anion transporter n=1 Tax=Prymnesium parvum TaxID=97485 RepID=A0AB34ITN3_PRYPA